MDIGNLVLVVWRQLNFWDYLLVAILSSFFFHWFFIEVELGRSKAGAILAGLLWPVLYAFLLICFLLFLVWEGAEKLFHLYQKSDEEFQGYLVKMIVRGVSVLLILHIVWIFYRALTGKIG